MLTATIACPGCTGMMSLTAWTPGRQLRCPRCKHTFRLGNKPGEAMAVVAPATPPAVPTPSPSPSPTVPARSLPSPVPARPISPSPTPAANGNRRLALIAAALGGLLLFVGGTVALAFLVARLETKPTPGGTETPVSQNHPRPPDPVNPPTIQPGPASGPGTNPVVVNNPPGNPAPMPPAQPGPVRRLPPDLQAKVDAAIDKGIAFLQSHLREDGTLKVNVGGYPDGTLFLVGLTLLECGIPPDDPRMVQLTSRVREYAKSSRAIKTYELTLALLYLDRLGDPQDKPALQSLGLHLLSGQGVSGGWSYSCDRLSPESEKQLLSLLERTRPEKAGELMIRDSGGGLLDLSGNLIREDNLEKSTIKNLDTTYDKLQAIQEELKRYPQLQRVVSLRATDNNDVVFPPNVPRFRRLPRLYANSTGDNSNTQFAALGLWAANRHGVPCERALALLSARFRMTQAASGGWGYLPIAMGETPAMTCAGLLALAIGHGVRVEDANEKRDDQQIQKGLKALARYLVAPQADIRGLYFMWSLERVGVLFNLEKVGDTDWYQWGAEKLVPAQRNNGSWFLHNYHGSHELTDTSFALLFLRQTNFVRDLSNKLEQVLDIKGTRRLGTNP